VVESALDGKMLRVRLESGGPIERFRTPSRRPIRCWRIAMSCQRLNV
jgi:hypothetical protein